MIIPFEEQYRSEFYKLEEKVFESNFWSDGSMTEKFENEFGNYTGLGARAISSCGAGLLAVLEYLDVRGTDVIVPANTFFADVRAVQMAGGNVVFADCNKEDLCLSFADMKSKVTPNTKVVIVVHIGGHLAFEIEQIVEWCQKKGIFVIEDCAHAHGAEWNQKRGGHYGVAGVYSFYATKTMPLGDGGMVVSNNIDLLNWVEMFRNYGKKIIDGKVTYPIKNGFNYRMTEFIAALGLVQMQRLPKIIQWKRELAQKYDEIFDNRIRFPKGMLSGYYKYIVFDTKINLEVGQVFGYDDLGNIILETGIELVNSKWITEHHKCVPIYYGFEYGDLNVNDLKEMLIR